jgi:DNA-directed RNA polymerase subunit RPC12/RpoP
MIRYKCEDCGYSWEALESTEIENDTSLEYEEEKEKEVIECPMCGGSYLEI